MKNNSHRIIFILSILILLVLACSFLSLPAGNSTSTPAPVNDTPQAPVATLTTSVPTYTIPVFEPTVTQAFTATEVIPGVTLTVLPPKKVKTPSGTESVSKEQVCPNALPTRLKLNGFAYLSYDPFLPNRIRIGPGVGYDAKGLIQPGEVMQLVSGPICSGESVWLKIIVKFTAENGWIAEADSEQYWLVPCPAEGHCPPLAP